MLENLELVKVENNKILVSEDFIKDYKKFIKLKAKMEVAEKQIKEEMIQTFETLGQEEFISNDGTFKIKYIEPIDKQILDTKKLKEECPEIYEKYLKDSHTNSSVRITTK